MSILINWDEADRLTLVVNKTTLTPWCVARRKKAKEIRMRLNYATGENNFMLVHLGNTERETFYTMLEGLLGVETSGIGRTPTLNELKSLIDK